MEALEPVAREVRERGSKAMAIACDVRDAQSVHDAVARTEAEWGQVDLAIANAGIGYPTPAHRVSLDDATAIMRTNLDYWIVHRDIKPDNIMTPCLVGRLEMGPLVDSLRTERRSSRCRFWSPGSRRSPIWRPEAG